MSSEWKPCRKAIDEWGHDALAFQRWLTSPAVANAAPTSDTITLVAHGIHEDAQEGQRRRRGGQR